MSREALQARAIQRAHDQHVHILAVPGRPNCYVAKSRTNLTERYYLVAGPDGAVGCSCKGFEYRQSCKHAEALKTHLAHQAVRAPDPDLSQAQASDLLWNEGG
jgi:hypothetical protein